MAGVTIVSGEVSPEISPTVELEGRSPEWDFLKGVRGCFAAAEQLKGGLTFRSKFRLRNPATSGVIAVVQAFEASTDANARLAAAVNAQTVDFATAIVPAVPDVRWGALANQQTSLIASRDNTQITGPAGNLLGSVRITDGRPWLVRQPFAMMPGTTFDWGCQSDDTDCLAWVHWIERSLPELEQ